MSLTALDPAESSAVRHDWTLHQVESIFTLPLPELVFRAQTVHRVYHKPDEVQGCALLSVKTGGCPEDCGYCPQSAHHSSGGSRTTLLSLEQTLQAAALAKQQGATRFCMGAAWRDVPDGPEFERVLEMVRGVGALGMETCCTLGMLTDEQALALGRAGLTAYNHNLDTSPAFYGNIITTHTYSERLRTLERIRRAGITICCGGIIGMGETRTDRCDLLLQLATLRPHPDSVPINLLVRVPGTPLAETQPLDVLELARTIATARILMPASVVRLSAGRLSLSDEAQALCFVAGANSIFLGEKLLTTPNPTEGQDQILLEKLGMRLWGQTEGQNVEETEGTGVQDGDSSCP